MSTDWIKWNGGQCPVELDTLVEVKYRGGYASLTAKANKVRWQHRNSPSDIVAYRVEYQASPKTESPLEIQVGGNHYAKLKIQPVEYIHANSIPFCEGSVIKYVTRWRDKGGIKDLEKARHFIDLLIQLERKA